MENQYHYVTKLETRFVHFEKMDVNEMVKECMDKWFNETLEAELLIVATLGRHDRLIRPRLSYAIDDHLRLTLGADVYQGSDEAFYGRLRRNSASMAELRFSW